MKGMEQLIAMLKELLADTVAIKFKAHGYHWNVETDDFPQYHEFFGDIYQDYDSAIDPLAEWIRMLGDYAPFKLSRFNELSTLPETQVTSDHEAMSMDLYLANEIMLNKFQNAFDMATANRQQGLANFFADRQTAHQKWSWQLKATVSEMIAEQSMPETQSMPEAPSPTVNA
jgi:starvation-inducible DNA-binding protein